VGRIMKKPRPDLGDALSTAYVAAPTHRVGLAAGLAARLSAWARLRACGRGTGSVSNSQSRASRSRASARPSAWRRCASRRACCGPSAAA
jgi:hypothetical protein